MAYNAGGVGKLMSGALEAVDTSSAPEITWPDPPDVLLR
ncbi:tail fiber assembly protein [Escherichia coli]|nr:tail fiber assembly protein [Escherichia coli]MCB6152429.1 tail fiber assembly protein [Escherichia coli]